MHTVFPRTRFYQLLRYHHFCSEAGAPGIDDPDYDRLYKVRPLLVYLQEGELRSQLCLFINNHVIS